MLKLIATLLVLAGVQACGAQPGVGKAAESASPVGLWLAHVESKGGPVEFGLEIQDTGGVLTAAVRNGGERIEVPVVRLEEGTLTLSFDYYDSAISATVGPGRTMSGQWKRRRSLDEWATMPFAASPMPPMTKELRPVPEQVTGRWRVKFASEEAEAVGLISGSDQRLLSATFLTTTGDYRFLAGQMTPDREGGKHAIKVSCFDGAHAFLFKAALREDGSLAGDFWSGATFHDTWTAVKDDKAALPDPFSLAKISGTSAEMDALRFADPSGVEHALGEFKGKARIIKLFGTWCPNCKDSVPVLEDLHARYKDKGLSIVGLAFEATGDAARDRAQVATYVKRFGIEYPVLIAGTRERAKAQQAFPMLEGVRAYPTFIFIDGSGTVRGVYTGFSGPATGEEHERLKAAFENKVKEMLAG